MMPRPSSIRNAAFTVTGLGGIGYMIVRGHADPTLVLACLALLGLPLPLRKDEKDSAP